MLSGNTDCYQPMEKKLGITRKMLEVFARYRHPVGIITKNVTLLRDIDLLEDLAKENLVQVYFSITTMDERLRSLMEPRTATTKKKLKAIEKLTIRDIPVGIMNAPIIPGLNHHESPQIIRAAAEAGALTAGYTVLRLNLDNAQLFKNWLLKNYPDRLTKIWNQISDLHGGKVSDSRFGLRMSGQGNFAAVIKSLFDQSRNIYLKGRSMPAYNLEAFRKRGNYTLFGS
jgi:DNA repair photolyase